MEPALDKCLYFCPNKGDVLNRHLAISAKKYIKFNHKEVELNRPVSFWREYDRLRDFPEETAVVVFRTRGCSWYNFSSCTMCGYFNDISREIHEENLISQIDYVAERLGGIQVLKVFTSGSFLDQREIPLPVRDYFFERVGESVEKILIESRTEYINKSNLMASSIPLHKIRIAIGLESSDDNIIANSINKGSTFSKYVRAAQVARELGTEVRTYLLFKPLFVSEAMAIEDVKRSVRDAYPYTSDISINPVNVQKNTLLEHFWRRMLYRPPRLWSLAILLADLLEEGYRVVSFPTGANQLRGVHNETEDKKLLQLILKASLEQDPSQLRGYIESSDLSRYRTWLEIENSLPMETDYSRIVESISQSSLTI